jgi:lipoprotein-releasing system permease protein
MKLPFQIAKRFLSSAKGQTIFIILGIAIGVSVQVFIGSLISGLQKSLVDKTIGSASQITIKPSDSANFLYDYEEMIADIEQMNGLDIITASVNVNGALSDGTQSEPTLLRGFNFAGANVIYGFDTKLVGASRLPQNQGEIALGVNLAEALNLQIGSSITFTSPLLNDTTLEVVGIFDFNVLQINSTWAIATLDTPQAILGITGGVSQIEMQIRDVFQAETISAAIALELDDPQIKIENWIENNQELLSGLQGQSISSVMIQVFVMISVILGISSILAITVMQKSKQIGILKAMGIEDKDSSLVFLFEGLILGIFGAIGGVLFGLGLAYAFTTFAIGADGNPVVPLNIDGGFIALSAGIAILASMLASLIPARKSSKLSVIEVIRNA